MRARPGEFDALSMPVEHSRISMNVVTEVKLRHLPMYLWTLHEGQACRKDETFGMKKMAYYRWYIAHAYWVPSDSGHKRKAAVARPW